MGGGGIDGHPIPLRECGNADAVRIHRYGGDGMSQPGKQGMGFIIEGIFHSQHKGIR